MWHRNSDWDDPRLWRRSHRREYFLPLPLRIVLWTLKVGLAVFGTALAFFILWMVIITATGDNGERIRNEVGGLGPISAPSER
jgi:hypothetical protein